VKEECPVKKLSTASVSRSGRTARSWNHETNKVDLEADDGSILFRFSLSSKGGGITDVLLAVGSADFAAMIATLAKADRTRAITEMASTVAAELAKQSEHDKVTVRRARQSVVKAADKAFEDAAEGRDHAERLTRDMVEQLVSELNKSDDEKAEEADAA